MFRLARTVPDGIRALMQAGGSPFDCAGRRPTYRIRMACKRSAVRARLAPPRSDPEFERRTVERSPREGHSEGQDPQEGGRLASDNASIVISPG